MLDRIKKGRQKKSHLVCLYGESGAGKTTFASQAPKPLFFEAPREDGSHLLDVDRIKIESWNGFLTDLKWFKDEKHDYKTLVIDTINRVQELLFTEICEKEKAKSIELAHGGFGKGASVAFEMFRVLIDLLAEIRDKNYNIIILCHARIIDQMDPTADKSYKKYELALYESKTISFAGLVREFVDSVLFSKEKTYVAGEGKNARGHSDKEKRLYTSWDPAFYAKSRYNIPHEINFPKDRAWESYTSAIEDSSENNPKVFIDRIERLLPKLKDDAREKVKQALQDKLDDVKALKALDKKVRLSVGEEMTQ